MLSEWAGNENQMEQKETYVLKKSKDEVLQAHMIAVSVRIRYSAAISTCSWKIGLLQWAGS